jgi:outer membrane protein OmpA-like peptidoglycan-associated protein
MTAPPVKVEVIKTRASLTVAPATLKFDEIRINDAAPDTRMDVSALTLSPVVDSVYGIAKWKVAVSNARGIVADLAGEGAPAPEVKIQLPAADLQALAAGGDLAVRMELQDKKGQSLVMDAPPVKVEVIKTRASLTVAPAALKFDEIRINDAAPDTRMDVSALTLRPVVDSVHGIAKWKIAVSNSKGSVAELAGEGAPAPEVKIQLPTADLQALSAGGDLAVRMQLEDKKGQILAMDAQPVKVEVIKTRASLAVDPSSLTIEEIRTIDASPLLNHVYFAKGSSEIPAQYIRLTGSGDTEGFDEHKFRDALEKYYQVLNIVGKRLTTNPGATITLVGCNDNTGEEKGNKKLSTKRAEAVRDYLQTAWNIAPERMTIEVRNLPAMPSATKLKEGQAENRRVEIRSTEPAILAPIQSTYFTNRIDSPALTVKPDVVSPHGIANWKLNASNTPGNLADLAGEGVPAKEIRIPLENADLGKLATGGDIAVKMELKDLKGHDMQLSPVPVKVNFIQTSQRLALKEGLRVQEKYALILFDFDKDTIDARNQDIVNTIVARAKVLPQATVEIVGHTDNIGKEAYNVKLSERRALAVYNMLKAGYDEDPGDRIKKSGVGPNSPLYDNMSPEARSFNRTVTITLEYLSAE